MKTLEFGLRQETETNGIPAGLVVSVLSGLSMIRLGALAAREGAPRDLIRKTRTWMDPRLGIAHPSLLLRVLEGLRGSRGSRELAWLRGLVSAYVGGVSDAGTYIAAFCDSCLRELGPVQLEVVSVNHGSLTALVQDSVDTIVDAVAYAVHQLRRGTPISPI